MDYVQAVQRADDAMGRLSRAVIDDLDEIAGGVGWWNGQIGWKRSALVGEYLLASCAGVSEALMDASLAIEQFAERENADNFWLTSQWTAAGRAGARSREEFTAASARGPNEWKRVRLMQLYRGRGLTSLATSLDRLAAVVVIVAGIRTDLLRVDWDKLSRIALAAAKNIPNGIRDPYAPPGSAGRERQNDLLDMALRWPDYGPPDWLPWLRKSRNTSIHRATRLDWQVMVKGNRGIDGVATLFWRQPEWSDTEAMLRLTGTEFEGILLPQRPGDVLAGLRASTTELVIGITDAAAKLWADRRDQPGLIVQNGGIWPSIESSHALAFPGYGEPVKVAAKEVVVAPDLARRLKAAKILEADRKAWRD